MVEGWGGCDNVLASAFFMDHLHWRDIGVHMVGVGWGGFGGGVGGWGGSDNVLASAFLMDHLHWRDIGVHTLGDGWGGGGRSDNVLASAFFMDHIHWRDIGVHMVGVGWGGFGGGGWGGGGVGGSDNVLGGFLVAEMALFWLPTQRFLSCRLRDWSLQTKLLPLFSKNSVFGCRHGAFLVVDSALS